MIVACVLITHFRAKAELIRRPELVGRAFAVSDRTRPGSLVIDYSPTARGVLSGMTLQRAVSTVSDLTVLDADGPYYEVLFDRLLDSLGRVSDMVEAVGLGEAYARLDGLEGLYGGEAGAVSALLDAVSDHFNPRVGVAGSKFPAYAAARTARPMSVVRAPDDVATFLAPLSIELLPVSDQLKTALARFGMRVIGEVSSVGQTAMFDHFGREGLTAWELSTGIDCRPFVPRGVEESVVEHTTLPFSTTSMEMVRVGVDMLLRRAFARPVLKNRSVGAATLMSSISDAEPWKLSARFRTPVERWERAADLIGERVQRNPPVLPVDDLSLTLSDLGGEQGVQRGLLRDARESRLEVLTDTDRRLRSHLDGAPALYRGVEVAPWHPAPEMRSLLVPVDPLVSGSIRPLRQPIAVEAREVAQVPTAARIGGKWRDIRRVEENWKFDLWWLPQPMTRSYYRVESSDGSLITLFRDEVTDRWYTQAA